MAIYHLTIKIISRSQGRSAVASAAYRSGDRLYSEETETVFDYSFKGGVEFSEIALPDNAPERYLDRQTLWNSVQAIENKSNSQLAREFEVALPLECSFEEWIKIGREFAAFLASQGMIVDWSIHNPVNKKTGKRENPHIHAMATTRKIDINGEWASKMKKIYKLDANGERIPVIDPKTGKQKIGAKNRKMWQRETVERNDWDDQSKALEWRAKWSEIVNKYLEPENRIDHRSYKDQGIDLIPTVHEGYKARKLDKELMQEKGVHADKIQKNIEIRKQNDLIRKLHDLIRIIKESAGEIYDRYKEQIRELGRSGSIFDRIRNAVTNTEYGKSGVASREPALARREREIAKYDKNIKSRESDALERKHGSESVESTLSRSDREIDRRRSDKQKVSEKAQEISKSWDISCSDGRYKELAKTIGQKLLIEDKTDVMHGRQETDFYRQHDFKCHTQVYVVKPSQAKKIDKILKDRPHEMMPIDFGGRNMIAVICNEDNYFFDGKIKGVEEHFWIYAEHRIPEREPELKPGIKKTLETLAKSPERQRTIERQAELKGGHGTADYGSVMKDLEKEAKATEKPSLRKQLEEAKKQVEAREAERQTQKPKEIDEPEGPTMGLW